MSQFDRSKAKMAFEVFPVEVLSVDYERKILTVQDPRDNIVYTDIGIFPAHYSSTEATDVSMPEPGATGLAANYSYESGFKLVMIIAWVNTQTVSSIDTIAFRNVEGKEEIVGWTDRHRGSYRKAYPGERTTVMTGGFAERINTGWDTQTSDWSRDKLDPEREDWTQITGRKVTYTNAGVSLAGTVQRPTAPNLFPETLPDGTKKYVSYLQPGAQPSDRYILGKQDVIPFSESTELVQEYALDYPVPFELLQTALLDTILGTAADPWGRTTVTSPSGQVAYDSETFMITQGWDHPSISDQRAVGPTLAEGATPQRRGYIIEKSQGTLVGYSLFDKLTYGYVLKPQLFVGTPNSTAIGKFGTSVESAYNAVVESNPVADHAQARLAASCLSIRFPYEQNTTRLNVTKEGLVQMEIGSTLPKENIPLKPQNSYEYPYGAGRSLEAHFVGSAKMVIGKNRDEEEALDAQLLGQVVLRLGADDTSLPNARRTVQTQIRSKSDAVQDRMLQYWGTGGIALAPGDAGNSPNWAALSSSKYGASKVGAENVSLRGAFDGGTVLRLGAKNAYAKRRHLKNGYIDGQGKNAYGVGDSDRIDSKSYRQDYGPGDSTYQFHDLTQAGASTLPQFPAPYVWSGSPITSTTQPSSPMDSHGQSLDLHANRDILLRIGANTDSGQSLEIDTAGGIVFGLGTDKQGRSITGVLDGGVEITIKPNSQGRAIRLCIIGDIDITHMGHLQYLCTGDVISEATTRREITKTDKIETQQKKISSSTARDTRESYGDMVNSQPGAYSTYSDENDQSV
jgi:hypothetical protein